MTVEAYPEDLLYTKDHEWARVETKDDQTIATIGISRFAVDHLGDVTQVELPKAGDSLKHRAIFGSVESVKAVSDLFAEIAVADREETRSLMDATAYRELVATQAEQRLVSAVLGEFLARAGYRSDDQMCHCRADIEESGRPTPVKVPDDEHVGRTHVQ